MRSPVCFSVCSPVRSPMCSFIYSPIDSSPFPITSLPEATDLDTFLSHLKQSHGVDLTGYKPSTLLRRIEVRMRQVRARHYQDYLDYLQRQPDEVARLLDAIFINYTSFFRGRSTWDYLAHEVVPRMIATKAPDEPIRVWSAGCASGEETYSLAILLAEALGIEQFHQRVRIYGTDIDSDAVLQARRGCYPAHAAATIPPDLLERYFEQTPNGYCWRRSLYRSISFHCHNLIQAPPLPQIDLLVCRNLLIYLTPEAQTQALLRFHFSLQPQGLLWLGSSESLVTNLQRSLFAPQSLKARIFTKAPIEGDRQWLPIALCHSPMLKDKLKDRLKHDLEEGTTAKQPAHPARPSWKQHEPHPTELHSEPHSEPFGESFSESSIEPFSIQINTMPQEIEWLREQVRSLQEELHHREQQQHRLEQELQATQQELALMNQEIQHRLQR